MQIIMHLDRTCHCKAAPGTNWSNRRTYRVFIINTYRDEICTGNPTCQLENCRSTFQLNKGRPSVFIKASPSMFVSYITLSVSQGYLAHKKMIPRLGDGGSRQHFRARRGGGSCRQCRLLHTWIILVIVKQHLVQIGRIDGRIE